MASSSATHTAFRLVVCSLLVFGVTCDYSGGGGGYGGDFGGGNSIAGGYDSYTQAAGGYSGGGDYSNGGYSGGSGGYSGGGGGYSSGGHEEHHQEEHHEAHPYEFGYSVKDPHHGTDFGQQETSDGHNVKGSYRVVLPDGRTQIVTYHADWKTGFHAEVKYEGTAHYPEPSQQQHHGGDHNGADSYYPTQDISSHQDYSGGSEHSFSGYAR